MNKIFELILLLFIGMIIYKYTATFGVKKVISQYITNSKLKGTYNEDYEKEFTRYLNKNLSIMALIVYLIMAYTNIFIGLISVIVIYLFNPAPKELKK